MLKIVEPSIIIKRTNEFWEKAEELNKFIKSLSLEHTQNGQLINLIIEQMLESERGAFEQGFSLGLKIAKSYYEEEPEEDINTMLIN